MSRAYVGWNQGLHRMESPSNSPSRASNESDRMESPSNSPSRASNESASEVVYSGRIEARAGFFSRFKERFFVLTSSELQWHTTMADYTAAVQPVKTIELPQLQQVIQMPNAPASFQLQITDGTKWELRWASIQHAQPWLAHFPSWASPSKEQSHQEMITIPRATYEHLLQAEVNAMDIHAKIMEQLATVDDTNEVKELRASLVRTNSAMDEKVRNLQDQLQTEENEKCELESAVEDLSAKADKAEFEAQLLTQWGRVGVAVPRTPKSAEWLKRQGEGSVAEAPATPAADVVPETAVSADTPRSDWPSLGEDRMGMDLVHCRYCSRNREKMQKMMQLQAEQSTAQQEFRTAQEERLKGAGRQLAEQGIRESELTTEVAEVHKALLHENAKLAEALGRITELEGELLLSERELSTCVSQVTEAVAAKDRADMLLAESTTVTPGVDAVRAVALEVRAVASARADIGSCRNDIEEVERQLAEALAETASLAARNTRSKQQVTHLEQELTRVQGPSDEEIASSNGTQEALLCAVEADLEAAHETTQEKVQELIVAEQTICELEDQVAVLQSQLLNTNMRPGLVCEVGNEFGILTPSSSAWKQPTPRALKASNGSRTTAHDLLDAELEALQLEVVQMQQNADAAQDMITDHLEMLDMKTCTRLRLLSCITWNKHMQMADSQLRARLTIWKFNTVQAELVVQVERSSRDAQSEDMLISMLRKSSDLHAHSQAQDADKLCEAQQKISDLENELNHSRPPVQENSTEAGTAKEELLRELEQCKDDLSHSEENELNLRDELDMRMQQLERVVQELQFATCRLAQLDEPQRAFYCMTSPLKDRSAQAAMARTLKQLHHVLYLDEEEEEEDEFAAAGCSGVPKVVLVWALFSWQQQAYKDRIDIQAKLAFAVGQQVAKLKGEEEVQELRYDLKKMTRQLESAIDSAAEAQVSAATIQESKAGSTEALQDAIQQLQKKSRKSAIQQLRWSFAATMRGVVGAAVWQWHRRMSSEGQSVHDAIQRLQKKSRKSAIQQLRWSFAATMRGVVGAAVWQWHRRMTSEKLHSPVLQGAPPEESLAAALEAIVFELGMLGEDSTADEAGCSKQGRLKALLDAASTRHGSLQDKRSQLGSRSPSSSNSSLSPAVPRHPSPACAESVASTASSFAMTSSSSVEALEEEVSILNELRDELTAELEQMREEWEEEVDSLENVLEETCEQRDTARTHRDAMRTERDKIQLKLDKLTAESEVQAQAADRSDTSETVSEASEEPNLDEEFGDHLNWDDEGGDLDGVRNDLAAMVSEWQGVQAEWAECDALEEEDVDASRWEPASPRTLLRQCKEAPADSSAAVVLAAKLVQVESRNKQLEEMLVAKVAEESEVSCKDDRKEEQSKNLHSPTAPKDALLVLEEAAALIEATEAPAARLEDTAQPFAAARMEHPEQAARMETAVLHKLRAAHARDMKALNIRGDVSELRSARLQLEATAKRELAHLEEEFAAQTNQLAEAEVTVTKLNEELQQSAEKLKVLEARIEAHDKESALDEQTRSAMRVAWSRQTLSATRDTGSVCAAPVDCVTVVAAEMTTSRAQEEARSLEAAEQLAEMERRWQDSVDSSGELLLQLVEAKRQLSDLTSQHETDLKAARAEAEQVQIELVAMTAKVPTSCYSTALQQECVATHLEASAKEVQAQLEGECDTVRAELEAATAELAQLAQAHEQEKLQLEHEIEVLSPKHSPAAVPLLLELDTPAPEDQELRGKLTAATVELETVKSWSAATFQDAFDRTSELGAKLGVVQSQLDQANAELVQYRQSPGTQSKRVSGRANRRGSNGSIDRSSNTDSSRRGSNASTDDGDASTDDGDKVSGADYKMRLVQLFEKHDPAKAGKVDRLLATYRGREHELLTRLMDKYGEDSQEYKGCESTTAIERGPPDLLSMSPVLLPPFPE